MIVFFMYISNGTTLEPGNIRRKTSHHTQVTHVRKCNHQTNKKDNFQSTVWKKLKHRYDFSHKTLKVFCGHELFTHIVWSSRDVLSLTFVSVFFKYITTKKGKEHFIALLESWCECIYDFFKSSKVENTILLYFYFSTRNTGDR